MKGYEFSFFALYPYLIISIVFLLSSTKYIKNGPKIIFVILMLFTCLRYNVGWDYFAYVDLIKGNIVTIVNSRFEPLSILVFLCAKYLNFYPLVFIFFGYLTLKLTQLTINKYSVDPVISWVVFYSLPLFYFASLSTIRQSIAAAFILFSYNYIINKKTILFLLMILIASLFHVSAIAGLLLLPLAKIPVSLKFNWILLGLSFLLSPILKNLLLNINLGFPILTTLKYYINANITGSTILQYLYYAIGVTNLLFYKKLTEKSEENKQLIAITTAGLFIYNLLSFEPVSAGRISAFFLIFWILIIPHYANFFKEWQRPFVRFTVSLFLILISFAYLNIYISAYQNKVLEKISFLPYKVWFNNL